MVRAPRMSISYHIIHATILVLASALAIRKFPLSAFHSSPTNALHSPYVFLGKDTIVMLLGLGIISPWGSVALPW
jgi:hypothetical protein